MIRHMTMFTLATVGFALMVVYAITQNEALGVFAGWVAGMGLGMVLMDIWIDWEHRDDDEDEFEGGSFDVGDGDEVQMGPVRMQFALFAPGMIHGGGGESEPFRVGKVEMDESKLPDAVDDEVPK